MTLSFNRARYLNRGTGRFWSQDNYEGNQIDSSSLHKYLYTYGNPVNFWDPSGREISNLAGALIVVGVVLILTNIYVNKVFAGSYWTGIGEKYPFEVKCYSPIRGGFAFIGGYHHRERNGVPLGREELYLLTRALNSKVDSLFSWTVLTKITSSLANKARVSKRV